MNRPIFIAFLFLVAGLMSCSTSTTKKPKDVYYDETMQAPLPIPSYTRNALDGWPEGRKVGPYDTSRVRLPEEVHSYEVGRLPSRDRREMHEAHTVYKVEQNARWDQRLPATPMASRGVVLGIREPSHDPVPMDQVLIDERKRQSELTLELKERVALLDSKREQIETFLASAPDKNRTIAELQQQKAVSERELESLKEEYRKAREDLREMKERQAMEEALQRTSKKGEGTKKQ